MPTLLLPLLGWALAQTRPADPVPAGPTAALPDAALDPALPLSPALATALSARDWAAAVPLLQAMDRTKLAGRQAGDHAFLLAWALQRAGRAKEAASLVEPVLAAQDPPPAYVHLVVGEVLLAGDKAVEAAEAFQKVNGAGPVDVRAQLGLAEAYEKASRRNDARDVYAKLAARPDPAPGSSLALWALAQRAGLGSPESTGFLRRLYRHYPGTAEDRAAAASMPKPSLDDLAWRADRLQETGSFSSAVDLLDDRLGETTAKDCVYRFAYGRAQHKLNNLTTAASVLEPLGEGCKGNDDDRGAKALYLAGKSLERKKDWAGAARVYAKIPALFPDHSMADDGYALGGIALQEAGDLSGARALWAKGFERHPTGDLAAESAWRLALGAWLAGDVEEAIRWADRGQLEVPLSRAPTDVLACEYWAARWRAWPSLTEPKKLTSDKTRLDAAIAGFESLASREPWHYYGILAASRLAELAPERFAALARPKMDGDDLPWQVRESFVAQPAVQNALALSRLGLYRDALAELDTLDEAALTGSEMAILTSIQTRAGDFLVAHDRMRTWLKTHPPSALGPNSWKVMRHAYPNKYWEDVQTAAKGYSWDPRVFHALVREESNFNPQIKSHAGACGLSQLMPTTASGCAKRMGLAYSSSKIWDVPTNLKIGAWYLDTLHARYRGNSALALAGYNAGEGNADKWLAARPDAPTDLYVETISFRETRHYVKRVLSTFQTYRLLYGDGPLYDDWKRFNHDAVP
ncbi:MAG: transglycosylase SLT domain-containing protein [Myxococcota bacterium]